MTGGARLLRRTIAERPARAAPARKARKVLVVGAGSGGQMVVREMQLNPNLGNRAIGFVDDDPRKRGMRNLGLEVLGTTDEIGEICDRTKPDEVFIAIPSAPGTLRAKVVARLPRARHPCADPARPCSSCCGAASSSPASCARSRWRTSSAATRW